ncbi:MAG: enolase-phosphatase E1 [Gammaproteobacteria bacterium]|jgi:enolase-phosphatase E1
MIEAIVTDIEGTTTSISFVYDVLFPYARKHIASFITSHRNNQLIINQLADIKREVGKDLDEQQIIHQLLTWMDEDKKISSLKILQGMIWEEGYKNSSFMGHVFEDVPPSLERWKNLNISIYVYSSGSIAAQKLLFSHTEYGDLTSFFADYFDTTTGKKRESNSYLRIAECIDLEPEKILFLSDVTEELDAAVLSGMRTVLICRDKIDKSNDYSCAQNFHEIQIVN